MLAKLRAAGLLTVSGILTLTAACTSSPASHGAAPGGQTGTAGSPPAAQPAGSADFALPIDSFAYTSAQNGDIVLAESMLTGACMRRFGFTYDAAADQAASRQAMQTNLANFGLYGNKRRYGVADDAAARRYGYHLPSAVDGTSVAKPSKGGPAHGLPALTPAMLTVLTGQRPDGAKAPAVNGQNVPNGGCRGQAHESLTALGTVGEIPLIGRIRADSFTRSVTDPSVTAAFKKWSACMSGKGYKYSTPRDAGADLDITTPAVPAREVAVATADVACKRDADVVRVWSAFETKYQNAQIDQHAQELRQLKADETKLLKKVGEIIATGVK